MSNMHGFDAAQRAWEAMTPPDDGPSECPDCMARGIRPNPTDPDADYERCTTCEGECYLNEDGSPFNPNAKAEAEEARAEYERDRLRDERMTNGRDPMDEYEF
jgi:hypothetical protein